jgi:hypothetical protein
LGKFIYAETAGKRLARTKETSGTQAGDPARTATAMIAIACGVGAPRHLVLGTWGFDTVLERMQQRIEDIANQRDASLSADYDVSD